MAQMKTKNENFGRPRWGLIVALAISAAAGLILLGATISQAFPDGLWH